MKLDIFNHIFPKIYWDKMMEVNPNLADIGKRTRGVPVLWDMDARFRMMDQFDDYAQVICLCSPPLEKLAGPDITPDLAGVANDGIAEYVAKYPDRFPAFIASLPMNNPDAALDEIEYLLSIPAGNISVLYLRLDPVCRRTNCLCRLKLRRSLQQHHLPGLGESRRGHPVEIHAGCDAAA